MTKAGVGLAAVQECGVEMSHCLRPDGSERAWFNTPEKAATFRNTHRNYILLASHHGREAGYCPALFEAMGRPRLVVISDGAFGDTGATNLYSNQARGWTIHDAAGESETRYCVTTRSDGHITIKFGWSADPRYRNILNVTTAEGSLRRLVARNLGF